MGHPMTELRTLCEVTALLQVAHRCSWISLSDYLTNAITIFMYTKVVITVSVSKSSLFTHAAGSLPKELSEKLRTNSSYDRVSDSDRTGIDVGSRECRMVCRHLWWRSIYVEA